MHVPASAEAKIARGREHIEAVDVAITAFLDAMPYSLDRRLKSEGRVHEYVMTQYTEPPEYIGLLVGDAVHNLRSALDHIVFSLAVEGAKAAGQKLTKKEARTLQYPICDSPGDFRERVSKGCLLHVDPFAQEIIELYQPYHLQPRNPERSVPGCLRDLDNTDKHRTIATVSNIVHWDAYSLPPGVERPKSEYPRSEWQPGSVLARYTFTHPHPELNLDYDPNYSLAIDEAWPPTSRASDVLEIYAGWIESFITEQLEHGPLPVHDV